MELERPSLRLFSSYVDFLDEIAAQGEHVWPARPDPGETSDAFVERILGDDNQTTYWATENARVVGHIGLRHLLNAELAEFGGHVGYNVRPSCRRRGLATEMLRRVLATPKAREIGRLLLTCAPDNVASNRTILANGGVLERTIFVERIARATNHYWITVPPR